MIKLKEILTTEDWASGEFDYESYFKLSPDGKVNMAIEFFKGPHAKKLTPPEIFHIILSLPRNKILTIYNLAKRYLTPEQLLDTKQQIESFHL